MKHLLREGAPAVDTYHNPKTVEAEWVLDSQGAPSIIQIPVGTGVCYRPEDSIVHLRNDELGRSRTYTPEIIVTVDHNEGYYELEFYNPNHQGFMPSVAIRDYISFRADNGQEGYTFSNKAMFETLQAFIASPVYNPFETPIPHIGETDACPSEDAYCEIISFCLKNDRPLPVWDRHEKKDVLLSIGTHDGRIASWNRETGEPEKLYIRGDNTNDDFIAEGHIDWTVFANELKLGHARWDDFVKREPFDPSQFQPRIYTGPVVDTSIREQPADTPINKGISLDSIFGVMDKILGKK